MHATKLPWLNRQARREGSVARAVGVDPAKIGSSTYIRDGGPASQDLSVGLYNHRKHSSLKETGQALEQVKLDAVQRSVGIEPRQAVPRHAVNGREASPNEYFALGLESDRGNVGSIPDLVQEG